MAERPPSPTFEPHCSPIGIDEVGRGAIAGPVVVGAVCLVPLCLRDAGTFAAELARVAGRLQLADSKQLSRKQRERVFEVVAPLPVWAIGMRDAETVDAIGIVPALRLAATDAITALLHRTGTLPLATPAIIADAGLLPEEPYAAATRCEVRADERILEVMLASITAKVWRDRGMAQLDSEYPGYGFASHAGYGTAAHFSAISQHGITPHHRKSFLRVSPTLRRVIDR